MKDAMLRSHDVLNITHFICFIGNPWFDFAHGINESWLSVIHTESTPRGVSISVQGDTKPFPYLLKLIWIKCELELCYVHVDQF